MDVSSICGQAERAARSRVSHSRCFALLQCLSAIQMFLESWDCLLGVCADLRILRVVRFLLVERDRRGVSGDHIVDVLAIEGRPLDCMEGADH